MNTDSEAPKDWTWQKPAMFGVIWLATTLFEMLAGDIPASHGAYWSEISLLGTILALMVLMVCSLGKLQGWVSLAMLILVANLIPEFSTRYLTLQFWVVTYFNTTFMFWRRLTLLRLMGAGAMTVTMLVWACLADPQASRLEWTAALLGSAACSLALMLGNGLIRGIRSYSLGTRQEAK